MISARSHRPIFAAAFLGALSVLSGCAANPGLATGSVFEKGSARPVSGVQVTLVNKKDGKKIKAPVNYGGRFSVDLPAGSYSLVISDGARQLCDEAIEVTVAPNQVLRQPVCIVPETTAATAVNPDPSLTDPSAADPSVTDPATTPEPSSPPPAPSSDTTPQSTPVDSKPDISVTPIPQNQSDAPLSEPPTYSSSGTPSQYPPAPGRAYPPSPPRE